MTDKQRLEGNGLIAEFMDFGNTDGNLARKISPKGFRKYATEKDLLSYHRNWEWLMPVVEKIESLGYIVNIYGHQGAYTEVRISEAGIKKNGGKISFQMTGLNGAGTKKEAIFLSVVDFINWYKKHGKRTRDKRG